MGDRSSLRIPAALAAAGAAALVAEALFAGHRQLPSFEGNDASGVFGSSHLPLVRITAVGDSTVTGPGLENSDGIWLRQLAGHLSVSHRLEIRSLAVGGSRIEDVYREQVPLVEDTDVAIFAAGANDALHGVALWRTRRFFELAIDGLVARAHFTVVTGVGDLGSVPRFPSPLARIAGRRGRRVDRILARTAMRHERVLKVPMWELTTPAFRSESDIFSPDMFHPSERGHAVWAEAVRPSLEAAIARVTGILPAGELMAPLLLSE